MADVVVVGAGPAGMAAAACASERGATVALIDAGQRLGGQIYRQPTADEPGRPASPAGEHLPSRFRRLAEDPRIELCLATEVWSVSRADDHFVVRTSDRRTPVREGRALVLATGASELVLPFPGWELPGVTTAGAAQALWKSQRLAVGTRVVVAGTGPLLLPVAAALTEGGAAVTLVEAAPPRRAPAGLLTLLAHPGKGLEAGGYALRLGRHRVRLIAGHAVVACEGSGAAVGGAAVGRAPMGGGAGVGGGAVERAMIARLDGDWRPLPGTERPLVADAVCVSYGFVPRLELARQLGVEEDRDDARPVVRVAADRQLSTSVPGLFVAGELTGIAGASVAELEGQLAGHAAASSLGLADDRPQRVRRRLVRRLERARRFAASLERLYPIGSGWTSWLEGSTLFCRCEQTPWEGILQAVQAGATTCREVRSLSRCGMGYCQGRTCGPALQLALASLTGRPLSDLGDLHKRPIAVPVPLASVASLTRWGNEATTQ